MGADSPEIIRDLPIASTTHFVVFDELVKTVIENTEKNLGNYYNTVHDHTMKSFQTARWVAVAGFVLIGIGMLSAIISPERGTSVTVLSGVAGVATEFISAIFFYLYNRTVRQMKDYHESLLVVQNILLSLKLVSDVEDPARKAQMLETLLHFLVTPQRVPRGPTVPGTAKAEEAPREELARAAAAR